MIEIFIFHLHIVAATYAFVYRWQSDGVKGGVLAVSICALVFVIGWSLTGAIARAILPGPFASGALFTSDTLSLVLLLALEVPFFVVFFLRGQRAKLDENEQVAS
jgi:hypothetical protein